MRLPVVQLLLFFYFVGLAIIAFKAKRKSIWFLVLFTLVALIFNITLYFTNPEQIINKRGGAGILATVFRFPFVFFLLLFALSVEAFLTREKIIVILAALSVFILALFAILFLSSGM